MLEMPCVMSHVVQIFGSSDLTDSPSYVQRPTITENEDGTTASYECEYDLGLRDTSRAYWTSHTVCSCRRLPMNSLRAFPAELVFSPFFVVVFLAA